MVLSRKSMKKANQKQGSSGRLKVHSASHSFTNRVLTVVVAIPKGKVLTYKEVADAAGSPGAYRAVGTIMSHNYNPKIPCHRVVRSDGRLGEYNRGAELKREKLVKEGAIEK